MSALILYYSIICLCIYLGRQTRAWLLSWDLGKGWVGAVRGYGSCFHGFVVRLGPVVHEVG